MKKIIKITIALVVTIAAFTGVAMLVGCTTFGSSPTEKDLPRMQASPYYDVTNNRFDNLDPGVVESLEEFEFSAGEIFRWLFVDDGRSPEGTIPQVKPNMDIFSATMDTRAIWFGHSSLLLRMSGKTILIDPVFADRASPVPFTVGRFQDPVMTLEELPEVDYIVISHDHYDHLDMKTVKFFRDKQAQFLVPLGVGSHLQGWGINESRIIEHDWWGATQLGGIEFIATPSRHFSGRTMGTRNQTLWASWVIRDDDQSVYFSGDSGYGNHFKEIGERLGPFDVAFIETGQYNERWKDVHMLPDQSAQAYFDLKAEMYVPIHWGMFVLSTHTWDDPAKQISSLARERGINLVVPKIGETVAMESVHPATTWWERKVAGLF